MQQDYARIEEWVANDLMLPLDGFVKFGSIDLSDVPAGSIDGGRVGGTLYAINLGNNSQTMVLDVDAFAQAGIELPPQDWTWADFERISLELHEKLGIWGVGAWMADQQIWKSVYLGHGEWGYSTDGKSLGYTDDQIFADYLHMLLRLQEAGPCPTAKKSWLAFFDQSVEVLPIVTKEAAMQSDAGATRLLRFNLLPARIATLCWLTCPGRKVGSRQTTSSLPSSSRLPNTPNIRKKQPNLSTILPIISRPIRSCWAERGVPISPKVNEALTPLLGKSQVAISDYLKRVEADSSPIRPADPPGHADFVANIYAPEVIDPVLFGLITPEEGVATLRELGSELLAKQE